MIASVAGGPLVSLLSAVIGFAGGYALFDWNPTLSSISFFFGILSGAIAFATAIPMALGGFWSDGARLIQLFRGGYEAERWCSIAVLGGLAMANQRARDWPAELVAAASQKADHTFDDVTGAVLRSSWHSDRDEIEEAGRWLDYAVEHAESWPAPMRGAIYVEAAHHYAFDRGDAVKGREFLKQVGSTSMLPAHSVKLAEGAVLLAEGDPQGAQAAAHAALASLTATTPCAVAQKEAIEKLLRRAGGA
jgi:hypothetical protein